MLRLILTLYLIFSICPLNGQEDKTYWQNFIDSLDQLKTFPSDEVMLQLFLDSYPEMEKDRDTISMSRSLLYFTHLYYNLNDFFKMEESIYKSLALTNECKSLPLDHRSSSIYNAAFIARKKSENNKANKLLFEALDLEKKAGADPYEMAIIYESISINYNLLGDDIKSLEAANKALELKSDKNIEYYKSNPKLKFYQLGKSNYTVGLSLFRLKRNEEAKTYFLKSLEQYNKYFPENPKNKYKGLIDNYHKLAEINLGENKLVDALININKSSKIQINSDYRKYRTEELLGNLYDKKDNTKKAKHHLLIAYSIADKTLKNSKEYPSLARILMKIGDLNLDDSLEVALDYYQKGLSFFDESLSANLETNPIINNENALEQHFDLLISKSNAANQMYLQSKNSMHLDLAINSNLKAIELIDKMRQNYLTDGSKFYLANKSLPVYPNTLELLFTKLNYKKDDEIEQQILTVIEKNKSNILFESISNKLNILSSKIPDRLREKEYQLKSDISFCKKLISEEELKSEIDSSKITKLKNQLFDLNEQYTIFDKKLRNDFPEYHRAKYQKFDAISLNDVVNKINKKTLILETMSNDTSVFIFAIGNKRSELYKIDSEILNEKINQFIKEVYFKPDLNSDLKSLTKSSKVISEILLKNIFNDFKNIDHLIIVSDGNLSKIPFEALIVHDDTQEYYLTEKFEISYLNSINQLFVNNFIKEKKKNQVLAFAPTFNDITSKSRSCNLQALGNLKYAEEELNFLESNYEGQFLRSSKATKEKFLNQFSNYNILHLATHACLNSTDPMLSEIIFANGSLTIYDIENMNANPELMVLNACNTGQGKMEAGEGTISLTRGFIEAGVQSLQSSLWELDDYSSASIVKSMYSHLKKGESKSNALRLAKLKHIKTKDKLRQHPYYWAGLIHIGDTSPIFKNNHFSFIYLIAVFAFIIVLLIFMNLKKRRPTKS